MARTTRQSKILELISKKDIETQEDLAEELKACGYEVTQATVSRDIKELGLIKIACENGRYKYAPIENGEHRLTGKKINMFRESVISINNAENLIVIKTISASATAAASAIDKMQFAEVLGCVAGDDTLLVVTKSSEAAKMIMDRLNEIMS